MTTFYPLTIPLLVSNGLLSTCESKGQLYPPFADSSPATGNASTFIDAITIFPGPDEMA